MTIKINGVLRQALVKMPFPVLKLPATIRKKIWSLVVQEEKPFHFSSWREKGKKRELIRVREGSGSGRNSLALILVSRQLENEAIPAIYGANTFSFDTFSTMDTFFKDYLPMRRYMQHIEITDPRGWRDTYRRTFLNLWPMLKLKSIEIDYHCVSWKKGNGGGEDQTSLHIFFEKVKWFLRRWYFHKKDALLEERKRAGKKLSQREVSEVTDKAASMVLNLIKLVGEGDGKCPLCAVRPGECEKNPERCKLWGQTAEVIRRMSENHRLQKMIAADLNISP